MDSRFPALRSYLTWNETSPDYAGQLCCAAGEEECFFATFCASREVCEAACFSAAECFGILHTPGAGSCTLLSSYAFLDEDGPEPVPVAGS